MKQWDLVVITGRLSAHDYEGIVSDGYQTGIGIFSCGELIEVRDVEPSQESIEAELGEAHWKGEKAI